MDPDNWHNQLFLNPSLNWIDAELNSEQSWILGDDWQLSPSSRSIPVTPFQASSSALQEVPNESETHNLSPNDEDVVPNAKRKERNRLAQKAFRERKEQYLRALERKVNELESKSSGLERENSKLRAELAALIPAQGQPRDEVLLDRLLAEESNHDNEPTKFPHLDNHVRISKNSRDRLLDTDNACDVIQTVWELIQSNDLFDQREVDIGRLYEDLRHFAQVKKDDFNLEDGIQSILDNASMRKDTLL